MGRSKKSEDTSVEKPDDSMKILLDIARSQKGVGDIGKYASILDNSIYATIDEYISTGSYSLNRLITGSIFNGIPRGRVVGFSGDPSTGKSFLCGQVIKNAQDMGYTILFYDSEATSNEEFLTRIGCDTSKIIRFEVDIIEEFKLHVISTTKEFLTKFPDKKVLVVLDSYANLSSMKEKKDMEEGKIVQDQGSRAKSGCSMFKEIARHCGKYRIPFIYTNHVYEEIGTMSYGPKKKIQKGGNQAIYMCSILINLSKQAKKEEREYTSDDNEKKTEKVTTGNILTCTTEKNRLCPEGQKTRMYLSYKSGPNPFYGLIPDCIDAGLMKEAKIGASKGYYVNHLDKTFKTTEILTKCKSEVFTDALLKPLDEYCRKKYSYSSKFTMEDEDADVESLSDGDTIDE